MISTERQEREVEKKGNGSKGDVAFSILFRLISFQAIIKPVRRDSLNGDGTTDRN